MEDRMSELFGLAHPQERMLAALREKLEDEYENEWPNDDMVHDIHNEISVLEHELLLSEWGDD